MTATYDVTIAGCDDSTYCTVSLTQEQYVGVVLVAAAAEAASTYGCQPTLRVTPLVEGATS